MNYISGIFLNRTMRFSRKSTPSFFDPIGLRLRWGALLLLGALIASLPARAQKADDDALTSHGITLYGVVDVGVQYDSHSAPFTPYRPGASGNIVRSNDYQSATGVTSSNLSQSKIGLAGIEALNDEWSAVFQVETFFNPQSGELSDALKSLTQNNGKAVTAQNIGVDGSSGGQVFQTAFVGFKSAHFGTLTFGRQSTLVWEGTSKYDPNLGAAAFGLLGASNTYAGAGSSEDNRVDSAAKYAIKIGDVAHLAAMYKFNGGHGGADTAFQANVGADFGGFSADAYYSKFNSAIVASALSSTQVATLPALGYSLSNSLAATISDNTTYALMASYKADPFKFFAGYENIKFANPSNPLPVGYGDVGGYVLAVVNVTAYTEEKTVQVYWAGLRYTVIPNLDLTAAYYGYRQNAFGTKTGEAGCSTSAHSDCSGNFESYSIDADYRFNKHFDAYLGAMYSAVHDGVASGYVNSTNINPTIGVRYKF